MAEVTDSASMPRPPGVTAALGHATLDVLQIVGECVGLFVATLWHCRSAPRHLSKILTQLTVIGTETVAIAGLVSLFVGMVMVVQAADQLANYTQGGLGSAVGFLMAQGAGPRG